uniref:Uncharacterized protein n=1 Tax=Oryza rufipogon TaxID=4529 RepID=A0A0E0NWK0_ORYRU
MASRRHGEMRDEARAKEREKSRGGGRRGLPVSIPEAQKWQAAAGTTVTQRPRARTRGAPASALPGATTPRRTPDRRGRRARVAQQGEASSRATPPRVGRPRRRSAIVVLLGRRKRRRRPLSPGRLRLRSAFFRERERGEVEGGLQCRVIWGRRVRQEERIRMILGRGVR